MKVTAKMIAQELKISTATVDRVLNNRKGVSEKTIKKVKEKAVELGYRPNKAAKFLATQKISNVAFILPIIPEYFWDEIEAEIKRTAEKYEDFGFVVKIYRIDMFSIETSINYIKKVIDEISFDALVIAPQDADHFESIINDGIDKGIPIFTLNNDVPNSKRISFVGPDYYCSGSLAAELIYSFTPNLKDIVVIREDENTHQMIKKVKGFRDYFAKTNPDVNIYAIPIKSNNIEFEDKWKQDLLYSCNAIYVASGVLGEVAGNLLQKNHKYDKVIIGHDISKKIYHYLNKNVIKSVICQDPSNQARLSVETVFEYLVSKEKGKINDTIVKLEIVMKANAKYYLK